jgi:hypothetical protein
MKLPRRRFLHLAAAAIALSAVSVSPRLGKSTGWTKKWG